MIEVDLLPKGRNPGADDVRRSSLRMLYVRSVLADPWVAAASVVSLLSFGLAGALFVGDARRAASLQREFDVALQDSARYGQLLVQTQALSARRDSIARRASAIGTIDARRYDWPRTLDEMAEALPADAWLTHVEQLASTDPVRFRVEGRASSNFALTRFWNELESSRSIGDVQLVSTEHVIEGLDSETARDVYYFVLEASQMKPPAGELDMVVWFDAPAGRGR